MNSRAISDWLSSFHSACEQQNDQAIASLVAREALWRDYLAFDFTLQTVEGRDDIIDFSQSHWHKVSPTAITLEEGTGATEGAFTFETNAGSGRGYIRLDKGVCTTLFTSLVELNSDNVSSPVANNTADHYVLIVGGGQGGLALGAQLSRLNVPYLIIDKYPRVGDQWRSRYDSLVLHDPVWYDHLPFMPYPDDWPIFTPKDQMGDWLAHYATTLGLNVSTNTTLLKAQFDTGHAHWNAKISIDGKVTEVSATHIVMALGLSGFPNTPRFEGQGIFAGKQLHSSEFKATAEMKGANVVVVGANNSAHDIACDLVRVGAKPVMLQRSSTLVVKQSVYCNKLLGKLYSQAAVEQGITADEADFLFSSVPMRLLEARHKALWEEIKLEDRQYYQQLRDAGFNLDFAEDGAGLGLKYRRTASGYYIDVGASEMVVDGRIGIRSGVNIKHLTKDQVILDSGESIPADMLIYATGYGNMIDWVAALIDRETADRVGPCWGYGSNTRGDAGPWVGELRNMWVPTAQEGLWFMGGNLAQARYFSRILAMQLQAKYLGI